MEKEKGVGTLCLFSGEKRGTGPLLWEERGVGKRTGVGSLCQFSRPPYRSTSHSAKQFGGLLLACPASATARLRFNQGERKGGQARFSGPPVNSSLDTSNAPCDRPSVAEPSSVRRPAPFQSRPCSASTAERHSAKAMLAIFRSIVPTLIPRPCQRIESFHGGLVPVLHLPCSKETEKLPQSDIGAHLAARIAYPVDAASQPRIVSSTVMIVVAKAPRMFKTSFKRRASAEVPFWYSTTWSVSRRSITGPELTRCRYSRPAERSRQLGVSGKHAERLLHRAKGPQRQHSPAQFGDFPLQVVYSLL